MSLQSIDIFGFNSGVQKKNKKPFLFMDDAMQELENAYCWREEIKKREGMKLVGRFRRVIASAVLDTTTAGTPYTEFNILVAAGITETNAQIEPGSVIITITGGNAANAATYTDDGDGTFTTTGNGDASLSYINYESGLFHGAYLVNAVAANSNINVAFNYFPGLPAMGILTRERTGINDDQTLWFDTTYCYIMSGANFQEFITGTTWNGTDSDFFWGCNYRGSESSNLLFFVTNFKNDAGSPLRYTDGAAWNDFKPVLSQTGGVATRVFLTQGRVIVSYYGRLLYLGVWETDADGAGNPNYGSTRFIGNRCVYSQIGNPLETTVALPIVDVAWRRDQFGRGGFIDAPTNQEIISATFYKNTLIVFFEQSTWRLQYLGEYGLPFIWERISSDYGSESTFSTILFDNGVLAVGDKAIVTSSGGDVQRIDLQIPDQVYRFKNADNGPKRVHGTRDFKKEVVYWCYPDFPDFQLPASYFPNKTLLYNYRNNTFAFFRNNVTCYGTFQYDADVSWDRLDIFWDDYNVLWASEEQKKSPIIVSGNQQGFAHFYNYPDVETAADSTINAMDQESLFVTAVTAGTNVELTIPNHNLANDEFIYLTGLNYVLISDTTLGSTTLNDKIYLVNVIDINTIRIAVWSVSLQQPVYDFSYTNVGSYMGGGVVALFPRMNIESKDFNPMKEAVGHNLKTSYIDFLFDASKPSPLNVKMKMNTTLAAQGNVRIGNYNVETSNSKTGFITNVTQILSPTVVITSPNHGLLTGDKITPQQVGGSTQLNENQYTITFLTTNTFSIQQASISAYTGGGYWVQSEQQYFTLSAQYAWHRFFSSCFGQFLSLILTYNNDQMSQLSTHQQNFVLNAMKIWYRPGGKNIFGK